jgi:hypothetical protein
MNYSNDESPLHPIAANSNRKRKRLRSGFPTTQQIKNGDVTLWISSCSQATSYLILRSLRLVSDWGEIAQLTTLQLERRRVLKLLIAAPT